MVTIHHMKKSINPFGPATPLIRGDIVMEDVGTPTSVCIAVDSTHGSRVPNSAILEPLITDGPIPQLPLQATLMQQREKLPRAAPCHMQQLLNPKPGSMPTVVSVEKLSLYLSGYPQDKLSYLLSGFTFGFKLEFQGTRGAHYSKNLKSALVLPYIVYKKLCKEIALGRIIGPFENSPLPNLKISPLGLVPKKSPGSWRLIHNLSFPSRFEDSVNAGISDESAVVHYASVDDAIVKIKELDKDVYLAKTDILSAFRIIPVHPEDYELLGLQWDGKIYIDRCLAMGCRTSCKIFEELSTAIEWIALNKLGIQGMVHVLDDFLLIEKSKSAAISRFKAFIDLCLDIGIPLSAEKKPFFQLE